MAINELTDEQIREMSVEQKDRWWLENVYRGNMPQLTIRSAITGMLLGGILSLSNLYVGAKLGIGPGVATTAVVLAFAAFRILSSIGLGHNITLLENNCMQSIATAAGYMTSALISSLPAYMAVVGHTIPIWQSIVWIMAISVLGALFVFPLKRRFINDEQLPFPEGRAAGRVMDALHSDDPREGVIKSRILIIAGFLGAMTEWLQTGVTIAGRPLIPHAISSRFDRAFEWIAARQINGVALSQLNVNFGFNAAIFAIGGLLGIRIGVSFLVGAILNFCIFAPVFIPSGDIVLREGRNYYDILSWSVWTGAAMLTTASILPIVIDWRKVVTPLMAIFDRKRISATDVLARIEIPTRVSLIGIPIVSAIVIWLAHSFFDVSPFMGALAIPIAFVLSVIAANTTGHTGQTPSGPMGKITQLIYAGVAPNTITTNVMAAGISSDAAISGSSLLQDIKPGYMLGGKPRHQAIGHILGIITGSIAATIVAYPLFIESYVAHGKTTEWPLPSAEVWRTVASFLSGGVESLPRSAIVVAAIFAIAGIVLELHRRAPNSRIPLHPIGIGFAFVIPFWGSFMLFAGAFTFWLASVLIKRGTAQRVFVINRDTLCAGIFTGASIAGVILAMYQQGFFG